MITAARKKAYNYGDLAVVKEIIERKFIITKDDNDYLTCCLIREIINEDGKGNMTQQRISQALLSYEGVRKKTMSCQMYYFGIKTKQLSHSQ